MSQNVLEESLKRLLAIHDAIESLQKTPHDFRVASAALAASHDYIVHARAHDVTSHEMSVLRGRLGARWREEYKRQRDETERLATLLLSFVPSRLLTGKLLDRAVSSEIKKQWGVFKEHESRWLSAARKNAVNSQPGLLETAHQRLLLSLRKLTDMLAQHSRHR